MYLLIKGYILIANGVPMKTLQQLPYDFSLNQELQQETVALMSVIKQIHTDDDLLIRKLREQLDTHTHRTTKKLELLKEEAALILEGLKLEEEEQTEEAEAQAEKQQHTFTTSRSLDLTGIRFIDVPDDLTPPHQLAEKTALVVL